MGIKNTIVFLAAMILGVCALDAQTTQQEFAQELEQKGGGVSSIRCRFSQTRHASFLANDVEQDGVFYLKKPDNIKLEYSDGGYIIMTAEWFEMKNADKVNRTKISANPMLRNLKSILSACMLGDLSVPGKRFEISVAQIPSGWEVTMKPKKGGAISKVSRILLNFDKGDMSLSLMKIEEKSGDYTSYEFYDKKVNVAVDDSLFAMAKAKKKA